MEQTITKLALINAIKFKGKANPKALIGAVIKEHPESKDDMKTTNQKINEIVNQINNLSLEEQKNKLLEIDPNFFENQQEQKQQRKEQRQSLPPLKNATEGKVTTRIPPEPSKYSHVGHAASFLINYLYANMYKGKCVIRFEDTNPEKASQEYVDAMKEDLAYLDIKYEGIHFVSDNMQRYYEFGDKLIQEQKAYTCFCAQADISKMRRDMSDCDCKNKTNHQQVWQDMKDGKLEDGSVTVRLNIDMQHKNAVMRDPVIFRLSSTPHYKQGTKYKVWPLYDFESAIEDGLMQITHVLRSNEFHSRIELQDYIRSLLNLPKVETKQYGRFTIDGATTKGREIRALIESGEYIGWDDPRLVTLKALKRRGIVKETLYELATAVGMSKQQTTIDYSLIASINRKILDKKAKRFFAIENPVEITIQNMPDIQAFELAYHPDDEKGERSLKANNTFLIEERDLTNFKDGELIRLMDAINIEKKGNSYNFVSESYEDYRNANNKGPIIHYIPKGEEVSIQIMMPDAKKKQLLAEKNISIVKEDEVIQFERWGFCRKDKEDFWFSHE